MDLGSPVFHPGILPKRVISRRERLRQRQAKKKQTLIPYVPPTSQKAEFSFENVYKGPIWWTPARLRVYPEARRIFDSVAARGPIELQERLRAKFREPSFYTIRFYSGLPPWSGPPWMNDFRAHQRETHKKIWKQVWFIYRKMTLVAARLKRFFVFWRRCRYVKACKNTDDIVTLEPPKQPVYIVDIPNRCSYVFEARSLRISMERRFMMCEYMFPEPKYPVNPLTNQQLTIGQCYSVIAQVFEYKQFSWALERFRAGGCNLTRFERSFRQYLKMKAIGTHFSAEPEDSMETTIDYFMAQAEDANIPEHRIAAFIGFMKNNRTHTFVREWFTLVKQYYLARELSDMAILVLLAKRTQSLLTKVYYVRWMS